MLSLDDKVNSRLLKNLEPIYGKFFDKMCKTGECEPGLTLKSKSRLNFNFSDQTIFVELVKLKCLGKYLNLKYGRIRVGTISGWGARVL